MRCITISLALCGLASFAMAQTGNPSENQNGIDIGYINSVPSISGGSGFGNPATDDLSYIISPADSFVRPDMTSVGGPAATVEVTEFHIFYGDTDFSTQSIGDWYLLDAQANGVGGLEPNWATTQPWAVGFAIGNIGLPNPGCAPSGSFYFYEIEFGFGGPGLGLTGIPADGSTALATVQFAGTGGETLTGGTCGQGDFSAFFLYSIDETGVTPDSGGGNRYGGYNAGGGGPFQDFLTDAYAAQIEFTEVYTTHVIDLGVGAGADLGQGSRDFSVANGTTSMGFRLRASGHGGGNQLAGFYGSLSSFPSAAPLILNPTGNFIGFTADLFDPNLAPIYNANGPILLNPSGNFFPYDEAASPMFGPLPTALPNLTFYIGAVGLDLNSLTLFDATAQRVDLHP